MVRCTIFLLAFLAAGPAWTQYAPDSPVAPPGRAQIEGMEIVLDQDLTITLDYLDTGEDGWRSTRACFLQTGKDDICSVIDTPPNLLPDTTVQDIQVDSDVLDDLEEPDAASADSGGQREGGGDSPPEGERLVSVVFMSERRFETCASYLRLLRESRFAYDREGRCFLNADARAAIDSHNNPDSGRNGIVIYAVDVAVGRVKPLQTTLHITPELDLRFRYQPGDAWDAPAEACFLNADASELCETIMLEGAPMGTVRLSVNGAGEQVVGVDWKTHEDGYECVSGLDLVGGGRTEHRPRYFCEPY